MPQEQNYIAKGSLTLIRRRFVPRFFRGAWWVLRAQRELPKVFQRCLLGFGGST